MVHGGICHQRLKRGQGVASGIILRLSTDKDEFSQINDKLLSMSTLLTL
jgi:hypothetical protein